MAEILRGAPAAAAITEALRLRCNTLIESGITPTLAIVRAFRERCAALAVDRAPPKPIVMGRDLVARKLAPGPSFGPILAACYEAQLAGEITDRATGAAFLDALLAKRG